ncbi:Conserved hypothetical protein CHP02001 [Methylophilaceae bacterium]|jgi:uncharacterized protein (TIGR02001 family)
MRKSLISLAVLSAFAVSSAAFAAEEAAKPAEPSFSVTTNIGFVSDYYTRGVSQSWHKPAVQGGFDVAHSSGFYAGVWGSNITPNTYPDANAEIDAYAGYNGSVPGVEGLGYTVGAIGYFYPGGSWKKYNYLGSPNQTPQGGRWDTYEANAGLSYKWLSAKGSVTMGDWFGAEQKTGWTSSTKGSTYLELNAAIPTPLAGLTLIAHVGHLNVAGKLNTAFTSPCTANCAASTPVNTNYPSTSPSMAINPDYTDWKVGVSKAFKIANADGWNAGVYYVGNDNDSYWGNQGYGGTSFNGSSETKNLNDGRVVVTLGRSF